MRVGSFRISANFRRAEMTGTCLNRGSLWQSLAVRSFCRMYSATIP